MKIRILVLTFLMAVTSHAMAMREGGNTGGGGDICENRIQIIRDDIVSWIIKSGHRDLSLVDVTAEQYASQMLAAAKAAKIRCVSKGDKGYPVEVHGSPKECRFDKEGRSALITCDAKKFESRSESDQYALIHHEYAGIADIERPEGEISDYAVSKQISSYLVDVLVKRLAVKPAGEGAEWPSIELPYPRAVDGWSIRSTNDQEKRNLLSKTVRNTIFKNCQVADGLHTPTGDINFRLLFRRDGKESHSHFIADPKGWNGGSGDDLDNYFFINKKQAQMQIVHEGTWSYKRQLLYGKPASFYTFTVQFDQSQKKVVSVKIDESEIYKENVGTVFEPNEVLKKRVKSTFTCLAK